MDGMGGCGGGGYKEGRPGARRGDLGFAALC